MLINSLFSLLFSESKQKSKTTKFSFTCCPHSGANESTLRIVRYLIDPTVNNEMLLTRSDSFIPLSLCNQIHIVNKNIKLKITYSRRPLPP